MRRIVAQAPTRIDFAGGTLDLPPLYLLHEPVVTVNVAIDLPAVVTITERADRRVTIISRDRGARRTWTSVRAIRWDRHPFLELGGRLIRAFNPPGGLEMETACLAPAGAGTGGSSALAVAGAAALARLVGRSLSRKTLIDMAKGVETQTIRVPTGYQDYIAAAYGGASLIVYTLTGPERQAIGRPPFLRTLEAHLCLVYSGRPRFSGANNWALLKARLDGERRVVRFFDALRDNALAMAKAFRAERVEDIARVLYADWEMRRRALPTMSTPRIDRLIHEGLGHGAIGARVCGAGGGGCVAFLIRPEARRELERRFAAMGSRVLPCRIARRGVSVSEVRMSTRAGKGDGTQR